MTSVNAKFDADWKKATTLILKACEKTTRGVAIDMFGTIIAITPVGNPSIWKTKYPPKKYTGGSLKGNWQCTIRAPATGTVDEKDSSKSGAPTRSKANSQIAKFKVGDRMYLTNNLPYAQAIEDGHSTQRPNGMVAVTVAAFQRTVDKLAKENKI